MPNPISNLTLYNCKLDRSGHKTIDFNSEQSRDNFFSSSNHVATIYSTPFVSNATFIRDEGYIKVGINADLLDANGVNYCRFNNPQSGSSQFTYAFIDNIDYIAPNTAALYIRIDPFVNNAGSINLSKCRIDLRSNATKFSINSDGGIYPTNVLSNVGYCNPICVSSDPLIVTGEYTGSYGSGWVLIASSESLNGSYHPEDPVSDPTDNVNGLPSSYYWYAVDPAELKLFNYHAVRNGDLEKIISLYYIPRSMITVYSGYSYTHGAETAVTLYSISPSTSADYFTVLGYSGGYIMPCGYKPKDQNLLRYPYCYAKITDRKGHELILKPELLGVNADNDIAIYYSWSASIGDSCGIGLTVNNYMGAVCSESCFSISDFPTLPTINDPYYNYMALNKNSLANMYIQTGISAATALVQNDKLGAYSAMTGVFNELSKQADLRNYPDSVRGGSTNNIAFNTDQRGLYIELWSIPYEAAETLDQMFEQSGDIVTLIDTPDNKMLLYDVIQTANSNVYGEIPKNEKAEIDRLYNEGLTIWHIDNGAVYNQYDLSGNTPL